MKLKEETADPYRYLSRPTMPVISSAYFTADDEVDLDKLGNNNLTFYVNYTGMQEHDLILPVWRGADEAGEPFDAANTAVPVLNPDPDLGMLVEILNRDVVNAKGGQAFLSYVVNGQSDDESFRRFCYVGVRPHGEALPVVQVIESHDRAIVLADLDSSGARVVVPAYRAMQPGDVVTLLFKAFDDQDYPLPPKSYPLTVSAALVGKPMQWQVPKSQFAMASDGRVEMHYKVVLMGLKDELLAPVQTFSVPATAPSLPAPLPKLQIDGYTGGPLNPGMFPSGMTLRLPTPASARSGDQVLLHWLGKSVDNRLTQSVRLDASSVPGSELIFRLDTTTLVASAGDDINVFYQIARSNWALSADTLAFPVEMPRVLPLPSVGNAAGEGTGKGVVEAIYLTREGARVTVPANADVRPGETLRVHWNGHANGGQYVADTPVAGDARTFIIPQRFVAANMELVKSEDEKRFEVTYEVCSAQGGIFSAPFYLRILPIPSTDYQPPQCREAVSGTLSLARLAGNDATVEVASWAFMAVGHLVTLDASGVDANGAAVSQTLLTASSVTPEQLSAGKVEAKLPYAFLAKLKVGTAMSINYRLSFDGGDTTFPRGSSFTARVTISA